ncbi:MAG: hypothetical protein Ct9H90mP9_5420 [Pseudomonadota bacterium]|nr:MAG: hypothetical protein Ct9H90mP9_5420 [Pseudomonadota bacterium]
MLPKPEFTQDFQKNIERKQSPGFIFPHSKPHPLLAPFYSAVGGLTFFFLLMFFQVTLLAHIF